MYTTRTMRAILGVTVGLMASTFCASPALAQQESSHVVVPASRINQLTTLSSPDGHCERHGEGFEPFFMVRLKASGDPKSGGPFIVPAGKNFVITDVVWSVRTRLPEGGFFGFIDEGSMEISIDVYSESDPSRKRTATTLPWKIIPADIGKKGFSGSHRFTTGIRIPAGHGICVRAAALEVGALGIKASSENIHKAYVQGYLIKTP